MINRRQFLAAGGSALLAGTAAPAQSRGPAKKKRLAVVTTLWTYGTHAWHMAERFLYGLPRRGKWHHPDLHVVSAYVDQRPKNDLSGRRAQENGFTIYPTVAEALRCGGSKLNVDAVLLIGEHGDYPLNEFGQKLYPRHRLLRDVTQVFREDGRSVPVFNDKHLSWDFKLASEMVQWSHELKFPLLAGSSLPVTWRMPAVDVPFGAALDEGLVVAYGSRDIYDFHAIETLQCMMERRAGGETGIASVTALEGAALWSARDSGKLPHNGWDPALFEACLSRSHTLKQAESYSHRYPTPAQIRQWSPDARAFLFQYRDGTRGTVLMLNGLVKDFTFAAKFRDRPPLSTLFHLPPNPNVVYSAALMEHAETMFMTGRAPYPVERTLLTSGMVQSGLQALARDVPTLATPHLKVDYTATKDSTYWRT